jgi:hypothetical protein
MSVLKHLTLGTGWGGYTLSTEPRPAAAESREDQSSVAADPVYRALLKRLQEESAKVSELPRTEAAHIDGDAHEPR